jgi:hypothetical protein
MLGSLTRRAMRFSHNVARHTSDCWRRLSGNWHTPRGRGSRRSDHLNRGAGLGVTMTSEADDEGVHKMAPPSSRGESISAVAIIDLPSCARIRRGCGS